MVNSTAAINEGNYKFKKIELASVIDVSIVENLVGELLSRGRDASSLFAALYLLLCARLQFTAEWIGRGRAHKAMYMSLD